MRFFHVSDMPLPFSEDEDPYIWLENLDDPQVSAWAMAKDSETRKALAPLSDSLRPRIKRYYTIPLAISLEASKRGVFALFRETGAYKVKLITQDDSVRELIDSRDLGDDILIKGVHPDIEGKWYTLNYSRAGSDKGFTDLIDTASGEVLDRLEGVTDDVTWLGEDTYYYVRSYRETRTPDGVDPPTNRVFLRENEEEEMVYGEGVPTSHWLGLDKSLTGDRALLVLSYGWHRSTAIAGELARAETWEKIFGGGDYLTYPVDFVGGKYFVASYDGEGLGRIVSTDGAGSVEEVVSEGAEPLQSVVVTSGGLVSSYMVDATSVVRRNDRRGQLIDEFSFDIPGSVSSLTTNGTECFFRYQSFATPHRVYSLGDDGLRVILDEDVPGDFVVDDLWSTSRDGTRIHSFVVKKRGSTPSITLLFGYGGFSIPLTPTYFPNTIPLLEDGGTFVMANLRGGVEYGEEWHRAGMREKKQNVFDDFTSVIEKLREGGSRVVVTGRSNGGLLVGAAMTQRPELLDGAVIGYPVLDMKRFHKLLIGQAWVPEYGDPEDPEDAEFLSRYSPYHNVDDGVEYPPTLLFTGLHDDRVHPAHALKFAAVLEDAGHSPLLRVESKSGHAGATPDTKIDEEADVMAFVYQALGMAGDA
jgi:prolyl oligopeptidase